MQSEETLGAVLQRKREAAALTLEDLASAVGVHYSNVYRYEQGLRKPRLPVLERLAAVLGLPISDLMALAGYTVESQLPALRPYLRTKYGLDDDSIQEISSYVRQRASRYGDIGAGPLDGEDERLA